MLLLRISGLCIALFAALAALRTLGESLVCIKLPLAVAVVCFGSFACRELGKASHVVRATGLDVILCLCLPSMLVAGRWLAPDTVQPLQTGFDRVNVLGWAIVVFVLGGVAAVDGAVLSRIGFRLVLPIAGASLAALMAGWSSALLLHPDSWKAFLLHVAPIMAGGLTAGALPLSAGYAAWMEQSAGVVLAQILPSVFIGNLAGIFVAGLLGYLRPKSAAGAVLQPMTVTKIASGRDVFMAFAALAALYGSGAVLNVLWGVPEAMTVVLLASAAALFGLLPSPVRRGAVAVSAFSARYLLFPLLWVVGTLFLPWAQISEGFTLPLLCVAITVVLTLAGAGFLFGKLAGIDPVDAAIIAVARASMGGTGTLAMLTAADRLSVLPFALLVVRLGGALTVAAALQFARLLPS